MPYAYGRITPMSKCVNDPHLEHHVFHRYFDDRSIGYILEQATFLDCQLNVITHSHLSTESHTYAYEADTVSLIAM